MCARSADILYHYCSVDSFLNIINGDCFWATDIRKSNDEKEYTWIRDKINEKIENYLAQFDPENLKNWQFGRQLMGDSEYVDTALYTFCLSESEDSLSQWRGYAQDGRGVAIGFSKEILQGLNFGNNHKFQKVIYDTNKQDKFIRKIVDESIKKMKIKGVGKAGLELDVNYMSKFPFYKNPSFSSENEWRLLYVCPPYFSAKRDPANINGFRFNYPKFKSTDDKIISYVAVNFKEVKEKLIKEIWIGPKSKLLKSDVASLLRSKLYYDNIEYSDSYPVNIIYSNSSYR